MKVKTETLEEKEALDVIDNKQMSLVELQNKIHAQNKEMGWWDEPRPFSTFVCLFHSELSEAMEGDRKGLMDDHLPKYEMFWVELADFVIRCLDWLGSRDNTNVLSSKFISRKERVDFLSSMHWRVSEAYQRSNVGKNPILHILRSVADCFAYAVVCDVNLYQIILEKVEYNKHRADHKRENREKEGGKKY